MPITTSHCSWPGLTRARRPAAGSGRLATLTSLRLLDLLRRAVADEDRLAAPEHLDDLPLGDRGEIDLDRGAGGDGRGVRVHLRDQRHTGPPRRRPRRRRRWRCRENRGASAPPKTRSSRPVPLLRHGRILAPAGLRTAENRRRVLRRRGGPIGGSPGKAGRRVGGVLLAPLRCKCKSQRSAVRITRAGLCHRSGLWRYPRASRAVDRLPHAARALAMAAPRAAAMRLALYQPDIPQNTGTMLRLCACLGVEAHIIEPAGFPVTDRAFRRAGMDYLDQVAHRPATPPGRLSRPGGAAQRLRLVLLTTGGRAQPTSTTPSRRTTCCCSAARAPACPRRCTRPPTRACASRCGRACARSMWRWRRPWSPGEALRQTGGFARR